METSPTVLIIEDSDYLAESLIDLLEINNYRALHAMTGADGVSLALSEKPDLIILDIRLPDISGYEVFNQIKASDWGPDANILILTASESIEHIAQHIKLPAERILFKPEWSMPKLLEKIQTFTTT